MTNKKRGRKEWLFIYLFLGFGFLSVSEFNVMPSIAIQSIFQKIYNIYS